MDADLDASKTRRFPARLAVLLCVLLVGGCGGDEPAPKSKGPAKPTARPSIVLVDVSGLRREDVYPATGEPVARNARRFLDSAASFSQAAATSGLAIPSLASVLTGWTPRDAGVEGASGAQLVDPIDTLAEMLEREGYATAAFVSGGTVRSATGLGQGFATWTEEGSVHRAAEHATPWLAAQPAGKPFFLFVVLDATGMALTPPAGGEDASDQLVKHGDDALGTLLSALARPGTPADLLTIVLSDHGDPRGPAPVTGSAGLLSDERIRVPLGVRGPGFAKGDVRGSCSLADVLPTVRDRMGLPPLPGLVGRSLAPLSAAPDSAGRPVPSQAWRRKGETTGAACLHAIRSARMKLVTVYTSSPPSWTEEVFDLAADPREASPLARAAIDRADERFRAAAKDLWAFLEGRRVDADTNEIRNIYTHGAGGPCGGH